MSEEPSSGAADGGRRERLDDLRARTSWDPEHDPDPVVRRLYQESQQQLSGELTQRKGA